MRTMLLALALVAHLDARADFEAEVQANLPSGEVKKFVFLDAGDKVSPIDSGFKDYNCMWNFGPSGQPRSRKFSIVCQEKGRPKAEMFGVAIVCGIGFAPAGLTFGKKLEYGFGLACKGSPE